MNVPEYAWINCSDYARVLNKPRYSYNIIIVTNVIILVILVCTIAGTLLRFYVFNTSQNFRITKALTTMTSKLSKYSIEQLGVFVNVKQQKWSRLKTKKGFLSKNLFVQCNILSNTYLRFWKFLTFSFNT